jgi:hypothetical protein
MSGLSIVPIQNSLAQDVKKAEVKDKVIKRVNELGLVLASYRMNNEFLLLVLNLIEHLVVKKDNVNKKDLALDIINDLFQMNAIERQNVSDNIEFLWSNKNIKRVSKWKLFKAGICELMFKKR